MKGLFVCLMLLSVGRMFGQQVYFNRYEGQSRNVTISLSDDGRFFFISRPPEALNPPCLDDPISFVVWCKGVYRQSNDSIVCIDEKNKATFLFMRLNKDSLEFKSCEGVDKKLSHRVLGRNDKGRLCTCDITLYEELYRSPLFRHTVKLRKVPEGTIRVVEWYIWREGGRKDQIFPRNKK